MFRAPLSSNLGGRSPTPSIRKKSDLNAIRKVLHPDKEPHASAHRRAELEAGAKAFNAFKFNIKPE
jgi:hypothetical protein